MLQTVNRKERLPLDVVANAAAAYAFRKIRNAYNSHCIRVRESSGNTLANIGFTATGELDEVALLAHTGNANGFIETWYDQSGNGVNLTQATADSQPQIVISGVVNREGSRIYIESLNKTLSGTLGGAIASNAITAYGVVRSRAASPTDGSIQTIVSILSAGQPCTLVRLRNQEFHVVTYATPNGSSTQTGDVSDVAMTWTRFGIAGVTVDGSALKMWANYRTFASFTMANTGASGTTLQVGGASNSQIAYSELYVYSSALSQEQIDLLYPAINEAHQLGPTDPYPEVANEERMRWDTVLRDWIRSLTSADRAVTVESVSWDGTYSNTDELLRIYYMTNEIDNNAGRQLEGIMADERWFSLADDGTGYGMERREVIGSYTNKFLRHFRGWDNGGSNAALLAQWYAMSIPKAGGAEGNPFYHQRGVAVRALIDAMSVGIYLSRQVDFSQSFTANWDFQGGISQTTATVFRFCKEELPLHVQNAYLEMLAYIVQRLSIIGPRKANANMEMKGVTAVCTIYSQANDSVIKDLCVRAVKRLLFNSETGTPDTSPVGALFSPAGHIREGHPGTNPSPETTYNGHSLYHLVSGLSLVRGDANWGFLATVVDRMCRFKFAQYFVEPDGRSVGPSGYGGRAGGGRTDDQGLEGSTFSCMASFSSYARPGQANLADEATLVAAVGSKLIEINATLSAGMSILTGTGLHTRGRSSQRFLVTAQANPVNTFTATAHGLNNGDLVRFQILTGGVIPGGIPVSTPGSVSTSTYFVINKTDDTFQVSLTLGGSAVTLTSAGTNPFVCYPAVYLGGSPNLVYGTLFSSDDFVKGTYAGGAFIGRIVAIDNVNKVLFVHYGINVPEAGAVNWTIENGPWTWGGDADEQWVARWLSLPDPGYYDSQRARILANDETLKTPWQSTNSHNTNFADEFWSYKDTDGSREFGFFIEALTDPGSYSGWYGGTLQSFWTRSTGTVICSRHDKSGDQPSQSENTRVYTQIDNWATSHVWIKDDSDMRFSSVSTNVVPSAVVWDTNGTPKTVRVELRFDHSSTWYGETWGDHSAGLFGSCTVQTNPTNTFTANAHGLQNDDVIGFAASSFPSPITAPAKYFVVNRTDNTWQVSAARGGSPITLTSAGSGVIYGQGTTLKGVHVINSGFEALSNGIKHEVTITHTGNDLAKEIWAIIPVYLRDGDQNVTTEATIEYWTGQSWQTVPTSLINAHYLRIGRDFGAGKQYVWIEFWQPTQPCCINGDVWTQSYQDNDRLRMIKIDMLGYTGSAKAIPPSSTIWYKLLTTDPGFVPTAPSLSISYPSGNTVWPEGGVFGVKAVVEWIAAAGTVYVDYRINAQDWVELGTLTNTTGNEWEYIGGSVPASMVELRVRAVPPSGNTSISVVVVYSTPYQLVVEDNFTAADNTVIDELYTSWTTNTTGHNYINMGGTVAVQSNSAVASVTAAKGALRFIDCDEENNIMLEAITVAGSTSSESGAFAGTGVFARARLSTFNEGVIAVVHKTGTPFELKESRDNVTFLNKTASYGSYSNTNPYRVRLQIHQPYTVARFIDINNGNSIAATVAGFTLKTSLGVERQGYGFNEWLGGSSIDELKIWKRDPAWTPPTIIPYEDPDPPPEITPDLTVLYPTAGLVFPVGGVWPFRAFVDWGTLTPSTVIAYYTTNGTDYTQIGALQLEAGTTYRYVGGTIPSGVTGIRVIATGMTESPDIVDVAVTSAATTTVLADAFTGANNTTLGSSWSGWQTNTTGNVYSTINGAVQITSNRAVGTNNSSAGNVNRINVNDADMIVELEMQTGTTALTSGVGVAARMNAFNQCILAYMGNTTSTTDCFRLRDLGGTQPTVTTGYASWALTKFFRIRLQTVGNCAVAQWFDIAAGDALAGTLALFDLTDWNAVTYAGWILGRSQQASKGDNLIVKTF